MYISIVVPVYNVPEYYLLPCLDSLMAQTLQPEDYEVVAVNDCSTDAHSITLLEDYAQGHTNFKVIHHKHNQGLNETRRTGARHASGDYVIFIDSDDMLITTALEELRRIATLRQADMVTAGMMKWNPDLVRYEEIPLADQAFADNPKARLLQVMRFKAYFTMCGRLYKRSLLTDDVFDLRVDRLQHEDITNTTRLTQKAERITHLSKPIYYYTVRPNSVTHSDSHQHLEGWMHAIEEWKICVEQYPDDADLQEALTFGANHAFNIYLLRWIQTYSDTKKPNLSTLVDLINRFRIFQLPRQATFRSLAPLLHAFDELPSPVQANQLPELLESYPPAPQAWLSPQVRLDQGLTPHEISLFLKDKIVFVCQVDYHCRNAAAFAQYLSSQGYPCVIMDNTAFVSGGKRRLPDNEHHLFEGMDYLQITEGPYPSDWLSTARLVITFNDFNYDFDMALELRRHHGLPTVCMIEGINDFLRVDTSIHIQLPYRSCPHVFLTGEYDRRFFKDRETHLIGLPLIEKLSGITPEFPETFSAVLNVNFTFGILESARQGYVDAAKAAFEQLNIPWVITQHPMDKAPLSDLPKTDLTMYELIRTKSVFISRFSTGILEALASGKPAIYFNPHGEKVDKFMNPMGAYPIATNTQELCEALQLIAQQIQHGVDFRQQAATFLHYHTGYKNGKVEYQEHLVNAVKRITESAQSSINKNATYFLSMLEAKNTAQDVLIDFEVWPLPAYASIPEIFSLYFMYENHKVIECTNTMNLDVLDEPTLIITSLETLPSMMEYIESSADQPLVVDFNTNDYHDIETQAAISLLQQLEAISYSLYFIQVCEDSDSPTHERWLQLANFKPRRLKTTGHLLACHPSIDRNKMKAVIQQNLKFYFLKGCAAPNNIHYQKC